MANRFCGWILAGALTIGSGSTVHACAFHGYTPDPTLVDILLATEQVVIARPASGDATRYAVIDTLVGPAASDLPLRVSATARQRLAQNAGTTMLLARDGAYGPWLELAVLDPAYREVIGKVMNRQSDWLAGRDRDRVQYFAGLLNSPNPDLRHLALREMDGLDYSTLRRAKLPAVRNLAQDLQGREDELRPIRLLLAGLSKDRRFGPILTKGLATAIGEGRPYLGAYATAVIELEGVAGVTHIIDTHLAPDRLSWAAREKLLEALAIQYRSGTAPIRRVIARDVARLSRLSPGLAEAAGRQFGALDRWGQNGGGRQADR